MAQTIIGEVCVAHPELAGARYSGGHCISCAKQKAMQRYAEKKDAINARRRSMCHEKINIARRQKRAENKESINKQKRNKYANDQNYRSKIIEQRKKYYELNTAKLRKVNDDWQKNNAEKVREYQRVWRANSQSNTEKTRIRMKKWRALNADEVKAKANSHEAIAYRSARRAVSKKATPGWANLFFIEEAYALAKLRTEMFGFKWHVDHTVPLNSKLVCGLHCEANLRVISWQENISKGNRYWPDMPVPQPKIAAFLIHFKGRA